MLIDEKFKSLTPLAKRILNAYWDRLQLAGKVDTYVGRIKEVSM